MENLKFIFYFQKISTKVDGKGVSLSIEEQHFTLINCLEELCSAFYSVLKIFLGAYIKICLEVFV
jgi:hypothetical protein